jgi:hypothetical protein
MDSVETVVPGGADLTYRGSLMKAAADGDVAAQRELKWRYDVWVYSPDERAAFMQRRGNR